LGDKNVNKNDILAGQLGQIMFPFSGAFVAASNNDLQFTPLITSSDAACLVDSSGAQFGMNAIRNQINPDKIRHVLAARLKGTFKTAFPEGKPAEEHKDGENAEEQDENKSDTKQLLTGNSTVLLFGDADFLNDRFCVRAADTFFGMQSLIPINDNLVLIGNAVEQVAGREELIEIRSRGRSTRPFEVVKKLEDAAMQAWHQQEQQLQESLDATRKQIAELQQQKQGSQTFILSDEQRKAIESFREKEAETSRQLKNVRKNLNKDIEALGVRVKAINIVLMPVLVIAFGIGRHALRSRRK
jgi:ABC-type uncharacterized transport system involved in gliding motility auxiliary subunit